MMVPVGTARYGSHAMHPALILVLIAILATAAPARAADSFEGCSGFIDSVPATINTQGVWCLRGDLATAINSGSAITIAVNNVTLDCNRFKLGGLAAGPASNAVGVFSDNSNATITNCNIRGFRLGVYVEGGGGHLIENNRFDNILSTAIAVLGQGSTIRDNRIFDTGGSTLFPDFAAAIVATGGIDIINNSILFVSANGATTNTSGISASFSGSGSVWNNRISGVAHNGAGGESYGIRFMSSTRVIVRDNDLRSNAGPGSFGITCSNSQGTAIGNVVAGYATAITNCAQSGNYINNN